MIIGVRPCYAVMFASVNCCDAWYGAVIIISMNHRGEVILLGVKCCDAVMITCMDLCDASRNVVIINVKRCGVRQRCSDNRSMNRCDARQWCLDRNGGGETLVILVQS